MCLQVPENTIDSLYSVRFSGAGVTDGCETPDVGAGNQARVICKSSKCFKPLSCLSSPYGTVLSLSWLPPHLFHCSISLLDFPRSTCEGSKCWTRAETEVALK